MCILHKYICTYIYVYFEVLEADPLGKRNRGKQLVRIIFMMVFLLML